MIGLAIGLVAVFVIGLTTKARYTVDSTRAWLMLLLGLCVGLFAAAVGYFLMGERGAELVVESVLWGLMLPVLVLGQLIRGGTKAKV